MYGGWDGTDRRKKNQLHDAAQPIRVIVYSNDEKLVHCLKTHIEPQGILEWASALSTKHPFGVSKDAHAYVIDKRHFKWQNFKQFSQDQPSNSGMLYICGGLYPEYLLIALERSVVKHYLTDVITAIHKALAAECEDFFPGILSQSLANDMQHDAELINTIIASLTAREQQILQHLRRGQPSKGIAQELNISYETLRTHRKNILRKLECRTMVQAAALLEEV